MLRAGSAVWCDVHGLHALAAVEPFHVAAFINDLQGNYSRPR
jgi:hypothetical protein